ncbi:MAG: hypothetical protein RBS38_13525 [Bacteroidales bacterium]|jgi:hypothetical protein|nr:hypothetical protein [Bacteroidales bacterium]
MKPNLSLKQNPSASFENDIYSKKSDGSFFSPFSISFDDMEHLILVNFEKDPDEFYNTFELQQARDKNNRKRFLVIAYRIDGGSDVYHQPDYPFASQSGILNNAEFIESPLDGAKFEINDDSLDVFFSFTDKSGRKITVKVNEDKTKMKKPFFLLAPVGVISKTPVSLPFYSLYRMSFIRKNHAVIEIDIDKVNRKPDTFPLPLDFSANFFTRYSADTFNVDLNKNYNGFLSPLKPVTNETEAEGITYELTDNNGHSEIKRMAAKKRNHEITIDLYPPLPDIACLNDKIHLNGNFIISTDSSSGTLTGDYILEKQGLDILMRLHASGGWQPNEKRWILKILFLAVKVFKDWPKSYVWNARISLSEPDRLLMKSHWERI